LRPGLSNSAGHIRSRVSRGTAPPIRANCVVCSLRRRQVVLESPIPTVRQARSLAQSCENRSGADSDGSRGRRCCSSHSRAHRRDPARMQPADSRRARRRRTAERIEEILRAHGRSLDPDQSHRLFSSSTQSLRLATTRQFAALPSVRGRVASLRAVGIPACAERDEGARAQAWGSLPRGARSASMAGHATMPSWGATLPGTRRRSRACQAKTRGTAGGQPHLTLTARGSGSMSAILRGLVGSSLPLTLRSRCH
jgi:hypothetical protein